MAGSGFDAGGAICFNGVRSLLCFNNTNVLTGECVWIWMNSSDGHGDPHRIKEKPL